MTKKRSVAEKNTLTLRTARAVILDKTISELLRARALRRVESVGDRRSIPLILRLIESPGGGNLVLEAARVLESLRATEACVSLRDIAMSDLPEVNRLMAVWLLGNLRDKHAVRLLVSLVSSDANSRLRGQAAEALGNIGAQRKSVSDCLISSLADRSPEVRFWAAFALGKLADVRAVKALTKVSRQRALVPGYWSVGREARDAIGAIKLASGLR